jgi:hypothetical protein
MNLSRVLVASSALLTLGIAPANAQERVDYAAVQKIRDEAFSNSQVMDTLRELTDVRGPRLTNSPQQRDAMAWAAKRLTEWGMSNVREEKWGPFGLGWSYERATVNMLGAQRGSLIAIPKAWTPGTAGPQRGPIVKLRLETQADLDKVKGSLKGRIVLLAEARDLRPPSTAIFSRYSESELAELEQYQIPGARPAGPPANANADPAAARQRFQFGAVLRRFLKDEGVLATIEPSERDHDIIRLGGGGSRVKGEDPGVPALVMAADHYNRLVRLAERKVEVELEIDVRAQFHDDDLMGANLIAEIPGTDRRDEVVMIGAHFDSWHPGTGATDNAAGSAVMMEALRIIKATGLQPRRTIRIGLWTGEEQGLLGSRAYVREHFGARPEAPGDANVPQFLRGAGPQQPLQLKPDHAKFAAYFNMDNGTGRIRGVYAQGNAAAVPVFHEWLKPFHDLDAKHVTLRNTGGTDHLAFDGVGLPGFQFIQDPADYSTRTHHTNLDTFDRIQREDVMQASAIIASFAYHAATRDQLFPRKPLPPGTLPAPAPSPAAKKK